MTYEIYKGTDKYKCSKLGKIKFQVSLSLQCPAPSSGVNTEEFCSGFRGEKLNNIQIGFSRQASFQYKQDTLTASNQSFLIEYIFNIYFRLLTVSWYKYRTGRFSYISKIFLLLFIFSVYKNWSALVCVFRSAFEYFVSFSSDFCSQ